jgi:hypothetical protein
VTTFTSLRQGLTLSLTAALLAACSGTAPPPSTPLPTAESLIARYANPQRPWIRPGAASGTLLYVTSPNNEAVYIFSYPRLGLVGFLGQLGHQLAAICSDQKGNVFVPQFNHPKILEYAHGGTEPIETLELPGTFPYSCAVDPTTGNLAVAASTYNYGVRVAIYKSAKGKPTIYSDPYTAGPLCGYDNHSNLFVDGYFGSKNFVLSELPKGAKSFSEITVNYHVRSSGNVQWDGKYITVLDGSYGVIYRLQIAGSYATVVGSTTVNDGGGAFGSWIQGHHVIVPDQARAAVKIYRYPAGGDAIKATTVQGNFSATVSVAPTR